MSIVRQEIEPSVELLCQTLDQELGSALTSMSLVGSAVTEDFVAGKSDINSVLVVESVDAHVLSVLARIGPSMGRKRFRAPLLMTPDYIGRSCDVFAVEWLDFQAFHQTVRGPDPFESLVFDKQHVRLQCEKQFKLAQIQMRQGYITSAERKDALAAVLTNIAKEMLPYLRAMLWLQNIERSSSFVKTVDQIRTHCSVDLECFKIAFAFRYEKLRQKPEQMRDLFSHALNSIESLSQVADRWGA